MALLLVGTVISWKSYFNIENKSKRHIVRIKKGSIKILHNSKLKYNLTYMIPSLGLTSAKITLASPVFKVEIKN